ncbi:MAG: LysE family translocator [Alphaproteobacteria bacterium]|nr:LysE family translocator [Alphaproteobacteria bacterium]
MTTASILAFIVTALAFAIVPGPTVTLIIGNSLKHGSTAGLLNVAGTVIGALVWVLIAALGLEAAIRLMGIWFDVLRYIGAAYLIWLGWKLWRAKGDLAVAAERKRPHGSFLLQGLMVILSNPKMLVLYGALIPPFVPQGADVFWTTLELGVTSTLVASCTDSMYALAAGRAGQWLSHKRLRLLEIVSGTCLMGGAVWMVVKGRA